MVVFLTPKPPYPLTSGMAIRQFHLLRAYALWGRVHLVTFCEDEAQRDAAQHLGGYCERVHAVSAGTIVGESHLAKLSRVPRIVRRVLAVGPTVISWSYSAEMARVVEELSADADIVHVARLHMAAQAERLLAARHRRAGMVLDLDDVEASYRFRQLRYAPPRALVDRVYARYDAARLWAYQASAVRQFDRVFVCSERDRRRFVRSSVVVVPNGTCVPDSLPHHLGDGRTIMFCGLLSYGPNIDGVNFLVSSVFPEIRRSVPDARLLIVGGKPPREIRAFHDGDSIVVAGDVPSVTEYYARSSVAIVPLRFGAGTRIKILEAWAHGVPVVSTTVGCEGLEGVHGRHLMVADSAQGLAGRCVALLRSETLRQRLGSEAWRLVSERYRWSDIGARAVAEVAQLLKSRTKDDEPTTVVDPAFGA